MTHLWILLPEVILEYRELAAIMVINYVVVARAPAGIMVMQPCWKLIGKVQILTSRRLLPN
jgi:hypothetical protein